MTYEPVNLSDFALLEKLYALARLERRTPEAQLAVLTERGFAQVGPSTSFFTDTLVRESDTLFSEWPTAPNGTYEWLTTAEVIAMAGSLLPVDGTTRSGLTIWGKALMHLVNVKVVHFDDVVLSCRKQGNSKLYCLKRLTAPVGREHYRPTEEAIAEEEAKAKTEAAATSN